MLTAVGVGGDELWASRITQQKRALGQEGMDERLDLGGTCLRLLSLKAKPKYRGIIYENHFSSTGIKNQGKNNTN